MEQTYSAPAILVETVGVFETNCYFVYPAEKGILYIIDPGGDAERIIHTASRFPDASKKVILFTHGHVDHITAAGEVVSALNITDIFLHPSDIPLYESPENALMPFIPAAENLPQTHWPPPMHDFSIITTPGHTPGSVSYYFESINALFSGDTLFASSIGRTDLPGGDYDSIIKSIKTKLMILPENLKVFPGHGEKTTIGVERSFNPYLKNL